MVGHGTRDIVLARLSSGPLRTRLGEFEVSVFHDGHEEAIVLSKGSLSGERDVVCRVHSECISSHVFLSEECDCNKQLLEAQQLIEDERRGLIIYLKQEGRGSGAAAHVSTLALKRQGMSQEKAYRERGYRDDLRTYDLAAKIIHFYQIDSIRLVSSSVKKKEELERLGVRITRRVDLSGMVIMLNRSMQNVVDAAKAWTQEPISSLNGARRIFVIGDLNVDYLVSQESFHGGGIVDKPNPLVGGTGFNAARAFMDAGFFPIVFGKIGRDPGGEAIRETLGKAKITALLAESEDLPTGECTILFFKNERKRVIIQEGTNANDYDLGELDRAIALAQLNQRDLCFLIAHEFVRSGPAKIQALLALLGRSKTPIVLDVVPHNVYEKVTAQEFREAIGDSVSVLLGEFHTFMALLGKDVEETSRPASTDVDRLFAELECKALVLRYGVGSISRQMVCLRTNGSGHHVLEDAATGYEDAPVGEKRGFGDRLTADLIRRFGDQICA